MSKIQLDNIGIKTVQTSMTSPIVLDITFTALEALPFSITWKIIYVGSAFSEDYDQILEEVEIEKIAEASTLNFELECSPPNFAALPKEEVICTTALILCGSYLNQEFIRVGYYVHNWVQFEEGQQLTLEETVAKGQRTIISEKPRITKFQILWGEEETLTQKIEGAQNKEEEKESKGEKEEKVGNQSTQPQEKQYRPQELNLNEPLRKE